MAEIHRPVLLEEVVNYLEPKDGGIYVDGTLGLGGHASRILECSSPGGLLVGLDQDAEALALARRRLEPFGARALLLHRNFGELGEVAAELELEAVDGILLDLGLSSYQLDLSGRGFSFRENEPLDMRMDSQGDVTAADLVNTLAEEDLADILYYYGEERQARRIAARLVAERQKRRIDTTARLAEIVAQAIPGRFHPHRIHVATRTFQGLRIAVNQELERLQMALTAGPSLLRPGGRFCVISFHSLEDRLVKRSFREHGDLVVMTRKPVVPGEAEKKLNPRARSAKLRVACRR